MSHIIAASGYNVSLVLNLASRFLFYFFSKKTVIILSFIVILGYAWLADLSPSVIRAASMAMVTQVSRLVGSRRMSLARVFALGLILCLTVRPQVFLEVSFHLSCLAILGLIHFNLAQSRTRTQLCAVDILNAQSFVAFSSSSLVKSEKWSSWLVSLRETLYFRFKVFWYVQLWILPYAVFTFGSFQPLSVVPALLFQDIWEPLTKTGFFWAVLTFLTAILPDFKLILMSTGHYLYLIISPVLRLINWVSLLPWPQISVESNLKPFFWLVWVILGLNLLKVSKNVK